MSDDDDDKILDYMESGLSDLELDDPDGPRFFKIRRKKSILTVEQSSFKDMFESILTAYDDERAWWVAVESLLKTENSEFAAKVASKAVAEGVEAKQQAMVEVMVDLLLDIQRISVSQGLVYVLDELESYPLEVMITELLKREAELETKDDYGDTLLLKAVKNDAPENVIDLLLEHSANVHEKTVLHYAAQMGKAEMIKQMIESGLCVNACDKDGSTPLHVAVHHGCKVAAAVLIEKGADVNARDHRKQTPLHVAAEGGVMKPAENQKSIINLLLEHRADVHAVAEDRKTVLHYAAQTGKAETIKQMIESGLCVNKDDKDGWTPLHVAVHHGCKVAAAVLIEKGADVNARDHRKRTPLHVAVEGGAENQRSIIMLLRSKEADTMATDMNGNTPVDLALKKKNEDIVFTLLAPANDKKDTLVKHTLETFMKSDSNDISDDKVREKILELSPMSVVRMFKHKKCGGEGKFNFIQHFVQNPKLKKSTMAILDQFVVGKRRGQVFCEVIDTDMNGVPPNNSAFDESSPSLLDVIVETGDKELARHPAIRTMLDYKWKHYARKLFIRSAVVYAVRMLFFGLALLIAARPDLDNPGCYRDGWDYIRGICEGISILHFIYKLCEVIIKMIRGLHKFCVKYRMLRNCHDVAIAYRRQLHEEESYNCVQLSAVMCDLILVALQRNYTRYLRKFFFKHKYNFLQLLAVILPLLIIPFRAATAWCASTGDGYCVDPTLLWSTSNASNVTLHINLSCITASSVQWTIASLAYLANAVLVFEYLDPFRSMSVYVRVLNEIIARDLCKFSVIFLVVLYIFVGSFYLALRAGVYVDVATGAITSEVQQFSLQTLYPWHVVFTGLRSLVEARGVLRGNYFANNDDGQYIGYTWFSIVLYMTFLFTMIVVLLNVLIAQMSNTYNELQENNDGTFNLIRAKVISRLQKEKLFYTKGESYWQHYFKGVLLIEFTAEEQKQWDRKLEKKRSAEMEQNVYLIMKMADEVTKHQLKREETALQYKKDIEQKVELFTKMTAEVTKQQLEREDKALQCMRLIEQKVDQIAAELTRRQQEREDTALQHKSEKVDLLKTLTDELTKRQQEREDTALQYKSEMEEKIDLVSKMTDELTRQQQEREDTALQQKRLMEQKIDQLTEMTAELTRRFQSWEKRWPFKMGGQ